MNKYRNYGVYIVLILLLISPLTVIPGEASVNRQHGDNITGNLTDKECIVCHQTTEKPLATGKGKIDQPNQKNKGKLINTRQTTIATRSLVGTTSSGNITATMTVGQTPYQLGPFFRTGYNGNQFNGWSWWDNDEFGTEKQKNLVTLMVLDNTTGTIKPVTGLTTRPTWPQASYQKHSGSYSYKADIGPSPITTLKNYPDNADIWMIKEIDLTGVGSANLTFWTWYSMETDWDYGYVTVSTNGNSWTNLQGTLTTSTNPNGNNLGNGITGSSPGWVQETMSLTPYIGGKILLGFRFKSDAAVNQEGWYADDITVTEGGTTIFSDGAETLTEVKTLDATVTYPHLNIIGITDPLTGVATLEYTQNTQQVSLQEDTGHPGTYIGYFKYDPFAEQYSGNYNVTLDATINGTPVSVGTQFQTTIFGCQNCHNKMLGGTETSFVHGEGGGMQSCTYLCHTGSRGLYGNGFMGPPLPANPMHVHEMQYGHRGGFLDGAYYPQPPYDVPSHVTTVTCEQCHTSFLHDNTGTDTAKIASYTLNGTNVSFSSGTHKNLTCENCHGTLDYPSIPSGQYQLNGKLGSYNPSFTSSVSFTDTYIVNVNGNGNLNIIVTGSGTTETVALYTIGPVDNTTTALQGPCGGYPCYITQNLATPINLNIAGPYRGTWLVKVIQLQEGIVNYTIQSNYPIERKPIIKIPECEDCHNSNAQGGAYTALDIPNWNPGFAHADTNGDGILDIQCRTCHNAIHNTETKNCRDCHTTAPTGHVIKEPQFSQYTVSQCLNCHGDPHKISGGGERCIECHGTNYTGASPSVSNTFVDIGLFNISIHQNINNTVPDVVTNDDCWMCHYNKNMDRSNVRKCGYCHNKASQWHGDANVTTNLTELAIR